MDLFHQGAVIKWYQVGFPCHWLLSPGTKSCAPRSRWVKLSSGWEQIALTLQSHVSGSCVGVPWHTFGSNNLVLIMKLELCKNVRQAQCIPLTGVAGRRELAWALPQHLLCCCGRAEVSYCLPKSLCVQDTSLIISDWFN